MPGKYKAYPEDKDSGVEWLAKIPSHWSVRQLKFLCSCNDEVLSETLDAEYEIEYVDISSVSASDGIQKTETMKLGSAPSRARRIVRDGDVIISTVRTYLEAISSIDCPPENLVVSTGFAVIRPNGSLHKRFAAYCLRAQGFIKEVVARSVGVSYPAINASDLINIKTPVPHFEEQEAIARFLDHETAKIDTLIEKQRQLIQLLKEKRQSVISHAVTKGLNPNAKMSESGIEWLGKVPAHWEIKRLKNVLLEPVKNGLFKKKEEFGSGSLLVNVVDLYSDNYFINPEKLGRVTTSKEERKQYKVESGDIFFVRSSLKLEGIGRSACFLDNYDDVVFECHIVNARPNKKLMSSKFLTRYLNSLHVSQELVSRSKTTTMTTIDQGGLTTISVLIPQKEEQLEIDNYLDRQLERIDKAENYAQDSITLLIERRAALISAAVTGKIDVRNWVVPQTGQTNKEVAA